MKVIASSVLAIIALSAAPQAFAKAESFDEISAAVKVDAFDKADDSWRRTMTINESACKAYGHHSERRIDVLIRKYQTLADAVEAKDEGAAMAAGRDFAATVARNDRYEKCWRAIAMRAHVKRSLPEMF